MEKSKVTTLMIPLPIHRALKQQAEEEGTSMSWIVVESLLKNKRFEMTQKDLDQLRGYGIAKNFRDRKRS